MSCANNVNLDMPEPFRTVFAALVEKLSAYDFEVYDHQPIDLYGVPSIYLIVQDVVPDYTRSDQSDIRIGMIALQVRYFAALDGDVQAAHVQVYDAIRRVYAALADTTLGLKVNDTRIERTAIDPVQMGRSERPMLMVEFDVHVKSAGY